MNKGALELRRHVPARAGTNERPRGQAAMAQRLGAEPDHLSRILSGKVKPSTSLRAKIEDEYGVSWRLFDEECDEASEVA